LYGDSPKIKSKSPVDRLLVNARSTIFLVIFNNLIGRYTELLLLLDSSSSHLPLAIFPNIYHAHTRTLIATLPGFPSRSI
jgi:hypothetical protein